MANGPLLTPPNSQDIKLYHDFNQRDNEDIRHDAGVLFPPTYDAVTPSPLQLFATTAATRPPLRERPSPVFERSHTPPYERYAVRAWAARDAPAWDEFARAGIARPAGVYTWDHLIENEAQYGYHFDKPSEEEYLLVARFLRDMQTWRGPAYSSVSRKSRSKVTKPSATAHRTGSNARLATPSLAKAICATPRRVSRTASTRPNLKGGSSAETKSARAPSSKPAKDPEWRNYPDYAPADQYMDMRAAFAAVADAKNFSEHKKGFDLMDDPERQYLNTAELALCERLALDCHRFMTSKRQIFEGYVKHLQHKADIEARIRAGLEDRGHTRLPSWNKTAAQSLMGIDVTKGSHIWSFYNEVGFFDEKFFQQFLR